MSSDMFGFKVELQHKNDLAERPIYLDMQVRPLPPLYAHPTWH